VFLFGFVDVVQFVGNVLADLGEVVVAQQHLSHSSIIISSNHPSKNHPSYQIMTENKSMMWVIGWEWFVFDFVLGDMCSVYTTYNNFDG